MTTSRLAGHFPVFPLSIRGRLMRAVAVGLPRAVYIKGEINDFYRHATLDIQPFKAEIKQDTNESLPKTKKELAQKHVKSLILEAFNDSGFDGNIYAELHLPDSANAILLYPEKNVFSAATKRFENSQGEKSAYVIFSIPEEIEHYSLEEYEKFCVAAYTVLGHEAIHVLHEHRFINAVAWACVGFSPILGYKFLNEIQQFLTKLSEVDADLTSVRKLGTAKIFAELATKVIEDSKKDGKLYRLAPSKSHPSLETRLAYFQYASTLFTNEPKLLKSDTLKTILQEKEKFEGQNKKVTP